MTSHFASFLNKTNIFHVVVDLYSNRSEKTSKCVKKFNDTLGCASCATSLFLPRFDVMCYVLLNRSNATWSAFLIYIVLSCRFGIGLLVYPCSLFSRRRNPLS